MKLSLKILFSILIAYLFTGCASLKEILAASSEVPTLERQMLRVSVGMTIVRQNDLMSNHMPISADATWPVQISSDISREQKKHLTKIINTDPYYATVRFTDMIQRDRLGFDSSMKNSKDGAKFAALILQQKISPLAYEAANKLDAMYGPNKKNWPRIFDADNSLNNFLEFKTGKLKDIESSNSDVYYSLGDAVIALLPISLQKDLTLARNDMKDSMEVVADLESRKGELESELLNQQIKDAKSINEEKEKVYFSLLDSAADSLASDLNIDDENYIKLANNVYTISKEIHKGSTQAYISFGLALRKMQSNNMLSNFGAELESLAFAKLYVPAGLQKKYNKRVVRVGKNAVYFLPNLFMGTYYAFKQSVVASKYEDIAKIIIEAYEVKYN